MTDIVSAEKRSEMMSGIRSKDTRPELQVRQYLHSRGFRFRLHDPKLPGKPDIVMSKRGTVIFVHGCFWHWHDCRYFKLPMSRTPFWREKLAGNKQRDSQNRMKLEEMGWRVIVVYECALRDSPAATLANLVLELRGETVKAFNITLNANANCES